MSPSLNLSWAKQIMAACPDIAIVGFGMWRTGWQNMFYRFRDGQIRRRSARPNLNHLDHGELGGATRRRPKPLTQNQEGPTYCREVQGRQSGRPGAWSAFAATIGLPDCSRDNA